MKVKEAMHKGVEWVSPDTPVTVLATLMCGRDIGAIPIGENDQLIGMVTDRDIVIRGLAGGKGPDTKVRDVMSPDVKYCYEDEKVDHVAHNMGDIQVRRLPVVNREKRLVGIVSIGDLSHQARPAVTGNAVAEISRPGGAHTQGA